MNCSVNKNLRNNSTFDQTREPSWAAILMSRNAVTQGVLVNSITYAWRFSACKPGLGWPSCHVIAMLISFTKLKNKFLRTFSKITKNKYCNRGLDISNIVIEYRVWHWREKWTFFLLSLSTFYYHYTIIEKNKLSTKTKLNNHCDSFCVHKYMYVCQN